MITDSGVCCAFNLHSELKESKYSQLVKEMQVRLQLSSFIRLSQDKSCSLGIRMRDMSMAMMTMVVMMVIVSSFLLQTNAGVVANKKVWNATAHAEQGLKVVIDRNFDR